MIRKLSAKSQVTIPKRIREKLGLKAGDRIVYVVSRSGGVSIRKASPVDQAYLDAVASTLTEARTDNNEAAAQVDAEWVDDPGTPSSLPRTGATVGGLILVGLGLVLGGRLLQRRARGVVA